MRWVRKIGNFFSQIYHLIKWIPVIWKDRDWDSGFIYMILEFKLKNVLTSAKDWNMGEDRKKMILEDLQICIKLLDIIANDVYEMEPSNYCKTEMIFSQAEPPNEEFRTVTFLHTNDRLDEYFKKNARLFKIHSNGTEISIDDRVTLSLKMGRAKQERAKKLLFKILHDRIDYWWD